MDKNKIIYYLLLPIIYLISILPFWLLYLISDFFFVVLYHLIGYRRKVVFSNLQNAFPEKEIKELRNIEKKYYSFLCDLILEVFKTITINEVEARKRIIYTNSELFQKYYDEGKGVVIIMGHYGNWELGGLIFSKIHGHQLNVAYKPLRSKLFNDLIIRTRTRFGTRITPMKNVMRSVVKDRKKTVALALIADQNPSNRQNAYWIDFLNQDTAVFTGPEKIAKMTNTPVIYVHLSRPKRGVYHATATLISENAKSTEEGEITNSFFKHLENDIRKVPELWLWSHRRWKWTR